MIKGDKYSVSRNPKSEIEEDSSKDISCASSVVSLTYTRCSRPGIAYAVCVLKRFQPNSKIIHWDQKILRYLQQTKDAVMIFCKC